jgi:Mrp family chromosome partitioning ATPase
MDSYLQLILKGIKPGRKAAGNSAVVAFTSALPQEGVSYVTHSFATELAKRTRRQTIIADVDTLQKADIFHYSRVPRYCCKTDVPYLYVLQDDNGGPVEEENSQQLRPYTAGSEVDQGISNLQTLRYSFDYILLDCPSMKDSGDAAFYAPAADGVVLVVESERTRKEQVRHALNTIEMAEANVLGCVLNKRRYPIPNWLYRRL